MRPASVRARPGGQGGDVRAVGPPLAGNRRPLRAPGGRERGRGRGLPPRRRRLPTAATVAERSRSRRWRAVRGPPGPFEGEGRGRGRGRGGGEGEDTRNPRRPGRGHQGDPPGRGGRRGEEEACPRLIQAHAPARQARVRHPASGHPGAVHVLGGADGRPSPVREADIGDQQRPRRPRGGEGPARPDRAPPPRRLRRPQRVRVRARLALQPRRGEARGQVPHEGLRQPRVPGRSLL
mmetsp:Transcript_20944/g.51308  ORF Transcript_20944/g.51308 Transcript_20944/m.51308 type:complete len:236 (+) Transcript_20944:410-1117(+)